MQIRLITTRRELAENLMLPMQNKSLILDNEDIPIAEVKWGKIEVERGAVETIFEIAGLLQLGNIGIGIVSGVIANWLWNLIKPGETPPAAETDAETKSEVPQKQVPLSEIKVEVRFGSGDDAQFFHIETNSPKDIKMTLAKIFELRNRYTGEKNGGNRG